MARSPTAKGNLPQQTYDPGFYEQLLDLRTRWGDMFAVLEPGALKNQPGLPAARGWTLLAGAMTFRAAGQQSEANDWLNHAMKAIPAGADLLHAEAFAEAGIGLFGAERFEDAAKVLRTAVIEWDGLTRVVIAADAPAREVAELGREVLQMAQALDEALPQIADKAVDAATAQRVVQAWADGRGVRRRAEVYVTYGRLLALAHQDEDARGMVNDALDWTARNFTTPGKAVAEAPLPAREMTRSTRRTLYRLLLAQGEIELTAEKFAASAERFEQAATMFATNPTDTSDISMTLQAKTNQANSLLRLGRYDEALRIYGLVEIGFRSIGDAKRAQAVAHAKLLAQTKKAGADGS